jgi:serine/threonine-protein phosphatase 6 regulatory ankyrin repeat subunit B
MTQQVIDAGAEIDAANNLCKTAIHWAAGADNVDILRTLINSQANINAQTLDGVTALHLASRNLAGIAALRLLIQAGADVNTKDARGDTALHWALRSNNAAAAALLVDAGADVGAKNDESKTPIESVANRRVNGIESGPFGGNSHPLGTR